MSDKSKIVVFPKLFKTNTICNLYESIEYFNQKVCNKLNDTYYKTPSNLIYSHRLIPEYFKLNLRDKSIKTKVIPEFNWGYSILLNPDDSIDGYMQRQFNSKKRNIFTRYVKRLETCFDIEYKMFYGNINESDYNQIMQALHNMIIARFKERNELHKNMHEWDYLFRNTYQEIINKKASLFVIYNKDEPIEVSLNYHFDKVLFSYVSSYDIDYSKFGLGHVEIYKQTEWCANNGYILFEMGVGGMDYKRRWSNNIYRYNHYIIYNKQSIKLKFLIAKIKCKEYLKSKKINEVYPKLRTLFKNNLEEKTHLMISEISTINFLDYNEYKKIEDYKHLKKHIYNFLYTTKNHVNDISVYEKNNNYIIVGKEKFQTITTSK